MCIKNKEDMKINEAQTKHDAIRDHGKYCVYFKATRGKILFKDTIYACCMAYYGKFSVS